MEAYKIVRKPCNPVQSILIGESSMLFPTVFVVILSVSLIDVQADLGLSITIPNLNAYATYGIGNGVNSLDAVSTSAAVNANVDGTGALGKIQSTVAAASNPLNMLFQKVLSATNDKTTNKDTLFTALSTQIDDTNTALATAKTTANTLGTTVKPSELTAITNAIDSVTQKVTNLKSTLNQLKTGVDQAAAATPAVTSSTVGRYVTPNMILALSNSLAAITTDTNALATALQTSVNSRNSAIHIQRTVNQTVSDSKTYVTAIATSFNNTVDNVQASLQQHGQATVTILNNAYSTITSYSSSWNQGIITNLTNFLTNYANLIQTNFRANLTTGVNYIEPNVTKALNTQIANLTTAITANGTYISNTGAASDSIYATGCTLRYKGQLLASSNSMNRLVGCVQLEVPNVGSVRQYGKFMLDLAKHDAARTMAQLQLCVRRNGVCDRAVSGLGFRNDLVEFFKREGTTSDYLQGSGKRDELTM